jgi:hypothetical protein
VKLILFSIGCFFIIDSIGTLLVTMKCRTLALTVFLLHLAPCFGVLLGGYCLLKSIL